MVNDGQRWLVSDGQWQLMFTTEWLMYPPLFINFTATELLIIHYQPELIVIITNNQ